MPSSCAQLRIRNRCTGFVAMTTYSRTPNVIECLYSLNFWPMPIMAKRLHGSRCQLAIFCLMGIQLSPRKRGISRQFSAHVCCGQTAGWIKIPLGTEVGFGPADIVLDGGPSPPKRATALDIPAQFSAYVYYCQTAGWIKMPLGTNIGLGPGHIVLDGD